MPYAVELFLDEASAGLVDRAWQELERSGVSSYLAQSASRPHITLAIYDSVDMAAIQEKLEALARQLSPFAVDLHGLGVFSGDADAVFLAATVTQRLLAMHSLCHKCLADACGPADLYYLPGNWVPHCTIAVDVSPSLTPKVVEICQRMDLPRKATIEHIGIVEFRPVRHLFCFPLNVSDPDLYGRCAAKREDI